MILGALLLSCTTGPAVISQPDKLTAPSPATGERVRFIALGDAGEGNAPQRRVAAAIAQWCANKTDASGPGCQFVAYLGDNFYPKGISGPDDPQWVSKWSSVYDDLGLPFYAVLGNHDYGNPPFDRDRARAEILGPASQSPPTRSTWIMPGPWYAFDAGPARFVALDTNAVMMGWTAKQQRAFATAQIEAAADRPLIVLTHHPFKSNGQHGNAGSYEGNSYIPYSSGGRVRDLYQDILCGHADLLLSGHEHTRQWLAPVCGMELVILGSGSKNTHLVDRGQGTLFQEDRERGFGWFEITAHHIHGELVDEHGRLDFVRDVER